MMIYTCEKRMKEVLRQDYYLKGIYVDDVMGISFP